MVDYLLVIVLLLYLILIIAYFPAALVSGFADVSEECNAARKEGGNYVENVHKHSFG